MMKKQRRIQFFKKLSFFLELFINGSFIVLYWPHKANYLPRSWNAEFIEVILGWLVRVCPLVILLTLVGHYLACSGAESFIRKYIHSIVVAAALIIAWGDFEFVFWLCLAHLLASVFLVYARHDFEGTGASAQNEGRKNFLFNRFRPAQLVFLSFLLLILVGSLLLMIPFFTTGGTGMDPLDALFIATSATCVTGLSTLSLADNFSWAGQLVVLLLIQVGGLGMMTIYASMTILLGKAFGMRDRVVMQDLLNVSGQEGILEMIIDIVRYTFWIELLGGVVLTFAFWWDDLSFWQAVGYGFFHSISAFCNAGFSLFPDSLESYSDNPMVYLSVASLVILGGVGFVVLKEIKMVFAREKKIVDVGIHTKIVLVTSLMLTVIGTLVFFFGEFLYAMDSMSVGQKLGNAFFQSVTLRTAGFNTIALGELQNYTIYFMTLFMFIGASSGSTGGGIKTTTFAILIQSISSTLRGRPRVEFFDRTIPSVLVVRATALSIVMVLVTTSFIFIMTVVEKNQSFVNVFFEVVSASGTVGLSLGLTSVLTSLGKVLISILMLIGRVGPLTLLLAITESREEVGKFEYPEGRLMIG